MAREGDRQCGADIVEEERMMEEWRKDIRKQSHSGKDQIPPRGTDIER